jgi:hypothetical protein
MKSAYFTTIIMGIVAAVTAAFAAASYPWPEAVTQNAQVSKPLFDNYETSAVRGIEVIAYDPQRSDIQRLRLKRSGQNWIIPQKNGFDVTGDQRVLEVTRALNDRTVLEVNSDSQTDHVNFGVVDPSDVGVSAARSRLGTKLILSDRDKKTIAHIIVGDQVKKSPGKHYVRVPGQPTIYTIEFKKDMLSTDFAQWVDPNLLKLPLDASSGLAVSGFEVDRHRIDKKTKKDQPLYKATFEIVDNQQLEVTGLTVQGKAAGQDNLADTLPEGFTAAIARSLFALKPTDVEKQSKAVMEFLEQSQKGTDQKIIAQLAERGFVYQGYQNDGHEFTGTNGEVLVRRSDGVKFRLVVGELANRIGGESLSLLYQAIVTAEVDPDAFAEIEEIDSDDEADQKVYLRQVKQRKEQIAAAQSQVKQLNRTHGEWIYVLDESVVRGLFPAIDSP